MIDIAGNANVQRVAGYYDLLDTLGTWLPIIAALLLLLSILIAPSRLGGLSKAAGWLAVSMVVLTVLLVIGRNWLISKAPLQPEVTQAFVRQLTVNLQSTIRVDPDHRCRDRGGRLAVRPVAQRRRPAVGGALGDGQRAGFAVAHRRSGSSAAVVALLLVLVLLTWENPGVLWAVVLALLAGLAAVVGDQPAAGHRCAVR